MLKYLYDDSGIIGMVKDGAGYYFHRNIQGDVVGVYNSAGTKLVTFKYDAFGRCTVSGDANLAQWCKIRYRGYYFDTETGLYWVQTRYYNPEWCRWISPDALDYLDPETAHGLNLYAYCGNDPVNFADPSGHFALISFLIGLGIGAAVGAASSAITQGLKNGWDNINWWQVLLDASIGGISGALGASGISKIVSVVAGGVLGVAGSVGGDLIASNGDWSEINIGKAILLGAIGATLGGLTGAGAQNTKAMIKAINAGKSWGSKAFLNSAKEVLLRPNSGLTLQTMYSNLAKAMTLYKVQSFTKVSASIFGSIFVGNYMGW